jgi:hypothetical protein
MMVGALTLLTLLLASSGAHASSYRPRYGYYGVLRGMLLYCGSTAMSSTRTQPAKQLLMHAAAALS